VIATVDVIDWINSGGNRLRVVTPSVDNDGLIDGDDVADQDSFVEIFSELIRFDPVEVLAVDVVDSTPTMPVSGVVVGGTTLPIAVEVGSRSTTEETALARELELTGNDVIDSGYPLLLWVTMNS